MGKAISQTKLMRFIANSDSMRNDPDWPLFEAGIKEGRVQMRKAMLGFLQDKYLSDDAPARGTVEAEAILTLARELSEHADTL